MIDVGAPCVTGFLGKRTSIVYGIHRKTVLGCNGSTLGRLEHTILTTGWRDGTNNNKNLTRTSTDWFAIYWIWYVERTSLRC